MTNFVRAYLRASTTEQDAERAKQTLIDFSNEQNLAICSFYTENRSGATLERPELFRLLNDCQANDILLIEDIDRLSRLNNDDWQKLKNIINQKKIKIVAVNVPTTWTVGTANNEFDNRMLDSINNLLIDMLAAIARRDYKQRRERQAQGIKKAKKLNKYTGRKIDLKLYSSINRLIKSGHTYREITDTLKCSSRTIKRAKDYYEELETDD